MSDDNFLTTLDTLNEQQKKAVLNISGSLLVCAGAGSGKTRIIAYRVAYLINHCNTRPDSIVALTFTNKAAREMKERINLLLGTESSKKPIITTFHGYALLIIRKKFGNTQPWSIIDENDQQALMSRVIKEYGPVPPSITPKKVLHYISGMKNGIYSAQNIIHDSHYELLRNRYEVEKQKSYSYDFDDLLILLLTFLDDPHFLLELRLQVRHLLIDEYQDTNSIQHAIVKKIALDKRGDMVIDSLCAVGDEDQSIYSWRGAQVSNIIDFSNEFKDATVITVDQNYRSVLPILQAANTLISRNNQRNKKKLWSQKKALQPIALCKFSNGFQESEGVVYALKKLSSLCPLEQSAILYRSHYQSRVFEEALIKHGLQYTIVGGIAFYERQEIKDLLAYLRLALNPHDKAAFIRCYNTPTRGLGDKFEEKFFSFWNMSINSNVFQALKLYMQNGDLTAGQKRKLEDFVAIFDEIKNHLDSAAKATEYIIAKSEYDSYLKRTCEEKEYTDRSANIREFLTALYARCELGTGSIQSVLEDVALFNEELVDSKGSEPTIRLMTLHSAKGLEFDTVFLVGLEDGIFPSNRILAESPDIQEERRLLYVGITRACKRLFISFAQTRHMFGTIQAQNPSRFLSELPENIAYFDFSSHPSYIQEINIENVIKDMIKDVPLAGASTWISNKQITTHKQIFNQKSTYEKQNYPEKKYTVAKNAISMGSLVWHVVYGDGIIKKQEVRESGTYFHVEFKKGLYIVHEKFLALKP